MIFDHIEFNSSFGLWNEILSEFTFLFLCRYTVEKWIREKKGHGVLVVLNCTNTFPEPQNQKNKYFSGKKIKKLQITGFQKLF